MNIKISAIIPCYNIERNLLLRCINSILRQDFKEYEVIIVDDGSDEQHVDCFEEVIRLDNRIRVIRQENHGVSAARNTGIRNAKGDYITFIDADDLVVPFFFAEAYQVAIENSADYVVGGVLYTQSRDEKMLQRENPVIEVRDAKSYRPSLIVIKDRFEGDGYFSRGPFARLVKKDIVDHVFFLENLKMEEDIMWNLDVISECEKVYMVYQIWYIYWINPVSVTHRYDEYITQICEASLEELNQRIDWKNEKETEAYFCHVIELLSIHVFRRYLGHRDCPLPRKEKRRMFRELCKSEKWTLDRTEFCFRHYDRKTQIKYLLLRFGLFYEALSLRKVSEKEK